MTTTTAIEIALCCGATCGRSATDAGPCAAPDYGRKRHAALTAAGYAVVPIDPRHRWYYIADDGETSSPDIIELLEDYGADIAEVRHAADIDTTWHVSVWDDDNGTQWREFATKAEAVAFQQSLRDAPEA